MHLDQIRGRACNATYASATERTPARRGGARGPLAVLIPARRVCMSCVVLAQNAWRLVAGTPFSPHGWGALHHPPCVGNKTQFTQNCSGAFDSMLGLAWCEGHCLRACLEAHTRRSRGQRVGELRGASFARLLSQRRSLAERGWPGALPPEGARSSSSSSRPPTVRSPPPALLLCRPGQLPVLPEEGRRCGAAAAASAGPGRLAGLLAAARPVPGGHK